MGDGVTGQVKVTKFMTCDCVAIFLWYLNAKLSIQTRWGRSGGGCVVWGARNHLCLADTRARCYLLNIRAKILLKSSKYWHFRHRTQVAGDAPQIRIHSNFVRPHVNVSGRSYESSIPLINPHSAGPLDFLRPFSTDGGLLIGPSNWVPEPRNNTR